MYVCIHVYICIYVCLYVCRSALQRDAKLATLLLTYVQVCAATSTVDPGTRAAVVAHLPRITHVISDKMSTCTSPSLQACLVEAGLASCLLDPEQFLQSLMNTSPAALPSFFAGLSRSLMNAETGRRKYRHNSRRLVVSALSSLIAMPKERLPDVINHNLHIVFHHIVSETVAISQERETLSSVVRGSHSSIHQDEDDEDGDGVDADDIDDDDDDDDDNDDENSDEDDGDGVDSAGLDALKKALRSAGVVVPPGGFHEDEDCPNEEDELFNSALEMAGAGFADDDSDDGDGGSRGSDEDRDGSDPCFQLRRQFRLSLDSAAASSLVLSPLMSLQARDPSLAQALQQSIEPVLWREFQSVLASSP